MDGGHDIRIRFRASIIVTVTVLERKQAECPVNLKRPDKFQGARCHHLPSHMPPHGVYLSLEEVFLCRAFGDGQPSD